MHCTVKDLQQLQRLDTSKKTFVKFIDIQIKIIKDFYINAPPKDWIRGLTVFIYVGLKQTIIQIKIFEQLKVHYVKLSSVGKVKHVEN